MNTVWFRTLCVTKWDQALGGVYRRKNGHFDRGKRGILLEEADMEVSAALAE
jgi:hypothetical protein